MPADNSIRFLVDHPNVRAELLGLIRQFLARQLNVHDFWRRYNFLFADVPGGVLSDAEMEFFSEVNDQLHYTDYDSPPDPVLKDPNEFISWLSSAFDTFQRGLERPFPQ